MAFIQSDFEILKYLSDFRGYHTLEAEAAMELKAVWFSSF